MPSAFTVQLINADKLRAGFLGADAVIKTESHRVMEKSLLLVEGAGRANAPKRTGRLAGGISHRMSGTGDTLTGEVGPSAKYGIWVERGSRAHWMPPGILPFPVMRYIATHNMPPRPYMKPAFEQNRGRIEGFFGEIGVKVVQSITHG